MPFGYFLGAQQMLPAQQMLRGCGIAIPHPRWLAGWLAGWLGVSPFHYELVVKTQKSTRTANVARTAKVARTANVARTAIAPAHRRGMPPR